MTFLFAIVPGYFGSLLSGNVINFSNILQFVGNFALIHLIKDACFFDWLRGRVGWYIFLCGILNKEGDYEIDFIPFVATRAVFRAFGHFIFIIIADMLITLS